MTAAIVVTAVVEFCYSHERSAESVAGQVSVANGGAYSNFVSPNDKSQTFVIQMSSISTVSAACHRCEWTIRTDVSTAVLGLGWQPLA